MKPAVAPIIPAVAAFWGRTGLPGDRERCIWHKLKTKKITKEKLNSISIRRAIIHTCDISEDWWACSDGGDFEVVASPRMIWRSRVERELNTLHNRFEIYTLECFDTYEKAPKVSEKPGLGFLTAYLGSLNPIVSTTTKSTNNQWDNGKWLLPSFSFLLVFSTSFMFFPSF